MVRRFQLWYPTFQHHSSFGTVLYCNMATYRSRLCDWWYLVYCHVACGLACSHKAPFSHAPPWLQSIVTYSIVWPRSVYSTWLMCKPYGQLPSIAGSIAAYLSSTTWGIQQKYYWNTNTLAMCAFSFLPLAAFVAVLAACVGSTLASVFLFGTRSKRSQCW